MNRDKWIITALIIVTYIGIGLHSIIHPWNLLLVAAAGLLAGWKLANL